MTLTVGTTNLLPYIAENGIEWSRNDVESPDAGRTLDGTMHRGRVTQKMKLKLTFRPMKQSEITRVLQALNPEYVSVTYTDPLLGERRNVEMYSNNISSTLRVSFDTEEDRWNGFSAPLIER